MVVSNRSTGALTGAGLVAVIYLRLDRRLWRRGEVTSVRLLVPRSARAVEDGLSPLRRLIDPEAREWRLIFLDIFTYSQRQAHWHGCREFIDREAIYRAGPSEGGGTHPEIPGKAGGT